MSHAARPRVSPKHPLHVTLRVLPHVPNLRSRRVFRVIEAALGGALRRDDFRVVDFSILGHHLHLLVEAHSNEALARGMQGFAIRVAKRINRLFERHGAVFADRYHARVLRTPAEVRNALAYVLPSHRSHEARRGAAVGRGAPDPFSSSAWFDGWIERPPRAGSTPPHRASAELVARGGLEEARAAVALGDPGASRVRISPRFPVRARFGGSFPVASAHAFDARLRRRARLQLRETASARSRHPGCSPRVRMFAAHVPAGYLITTIVSPRASGRMVALGLFASAAPDLDLFWFYFVDDRSVPHHAYWTHVPFWWAMLAAAWLAAAHLRGSREALMAGAVCFVNVFGHLVLDTVAGGIRWLAPFSERSFVLVSVPARHGWWVSNFVLHWTILAEVAIVACALGALVAGRRLRGLDAAAPGRSPAAVDRTSHLEATTSRPGS